MTGPVKQAALLLSSILATLPLLLATAQTPRSASDAHADRVRLAQGRSRLYGTQFERVDGTLRPRPIEDAAGVAGRRAALGLETLDEYAARMEDLYASDDKN